MFGPGVWWKHSTSRNLIYRTENQPMTKSDTSNPTHAYSSQLSGYKKYALTMSHLMGHNLTRSLTHDLNELVGTFNSAPDDFLQSRATPWRGGVQPRAASRDPASRLPSAGTPPIPIDLGFRILEGFDRGVNLPIFSPACSLFLPTGGWFPLPPPRVR